MQNAVVGTTKIDVTIKTCIDYPINTDPIITKYMKEVYELE